MIELVEDAKAQLRCQGWAHFHTPRLETAAMEEMALQIAHALGEPRPTRRRGSLVDHLVPTDSAKAHPRSLSACYGLSEFPWHTDGAHWGAPPRYLVMGCIEADQHAAATFIADGHGFPFLQSPTARAAVFRVSNGSKSFYASARDSFDRFYRYDPGCMTPMNEDALAIAVAMDEVSNQAENRVNWCIGTFLLLDNWRVMHRRGAALGGARRKLLRVTVMERL